MYMSDNDKFSHAERGRVSVATEGLSQPEAPEATVSELRRAATDATQWGCSRPASPKLPWATFTVLRGFFLFTLHIDTELGHTHKATTVRGN